MSSSKLLSSSGTESETERMTDFEKLGLQPYSLETTNQGLQLLWQEFYE